MSDIPIYAIIGRGYAAAVNYETLRLAGDARLRKDRKVVFFGKPDPWLQFTDHPMGQCKTLMSVPGFDDQSKGETYCNSQDFAVRTGNQFQSILRREGVGVDNRELEHCRNDGHGGFELRLIDPQTGRRSRDTAAFVDVCTGLGSPKHLWGSDGQLLIATGRAVQATTFMGRDYTPVVEPIKDNVVAVCGGGAVAALCCELAFQRGARKIIWASNDEFAGAFLPSGRFESLGRRAGGRILKLDPRIRLFTYSDVSPSRKHGGNLDVSIKPIPGKYACIIDEAGERKLERPQDETCSLLIVATGFPQNQADDILSGVAGDSWLAIRGRTPGLKGVPVGLEDPTGHVRVLGAAALNHRDFSGHFERNATVREWFDSLSLQLKAPGTPLPPSVAVAARFIAEANGYFPRFAKEGPGPNWNCAFKANIEQCLPSELFQALASDVDDWLGQRSSSNVLQQVPPFARDASGNALGDVVYAIPAAGGAERAA